MADDKDKSDGIVAEAKKRFELARDAYHESRRLAIEDTKFALGDSDNGWQWPDSIHRQRSILEQRPCLTVNITAQHCNQIINNIRQNRPAARVIPASLGADKKTAELLAGLIRNIQSVSCAADAHDTAAEHAIYGGEGYWRILTDYENETSFEQVIQIKPILNPQLVYIDPNCHEIDKSDATFGFVFEDISREQCKREHPGIDPASWVQDRHGWVNEDTIRRAEYFYLTQVEDEACLLADGTTALKSQLPEGAEVVRTRKTFRKQWKWCKLLGGEEKPVDERDWPGAYLPIISVVGKEVNVDGKLVKKGIVRDLKDPARMVNYSYSAAIESVALQNKIPYMAAVEAIEGYEDIWAHANNENRAYLPYNALDQEGNPIPRPERQAPAVLPAAQVQLLQLSTEQMRAASGQQNANFGIKSEAQSGIGIQRLKVQGDTATFHFPDNLVRALRYEARVLIDLIPKVYDTERVVRVLNLDGKDEQALLNPEFEQPYAEVGGSAIEKIFNPTLGLYDVAIDTGPSYQTQRQEAADRLTELASRNPTLMQVAGDLIVRSYDFPMADQLANRLEKALPPNLQDDENDLPPQVLQTMQALKQQIDEMGAALNNAAAQVDALEEKREVELKKLMIDAYGKETDRIKALGTGMSAEQVQALVLQTLAQALSAPDPAALVGEDIAEHEAQEHGQPAMPPPEAPPPEPPAAAGFFTPAAEEPRIGAVPPSLPME